MKSQCSLVSNFLNQPIRFRSSFPRIPVIGRKKIGPRRFFKDGRQTPDWCTHGNINKKLNLLQANVIEKRCDIESGKRFFKLDLFTKFLTF